MNFSFCSLVHFSAFAGAELEHVSSLIGDACSPPFHINPGVGGLDIGVGTGVSNHFSEEYFYTLGFALRYWFFLWRLTPGCVNVGESRNRISPESYRGVSNTTSSCRDIASQKSPHHPPPRPKLALFGSLLDRRIYTPSGFYSYPGGIGRRNASATGMRFGPQECFTIWARGVAPTFVLRYRDLGRLGIS